MINFHKPYRMKDSIPYIEDVLDFGDAGGDGSYTKRCTKWLREKLKVKEILMMTSCTHALECALQAIDLQQGEEVIIPSFTFPSTANAVLLAGGTVVFSEVEPNHLTMDPNYIEEKITDKTKAIIVVHYGGICCDMDPIMAVAKEYNLIVVEDGAQSFLSTYRGHYAGTIGHFGCLSFHGTKDIVSGEGGALVINDSQYYEKCRNFRQKGTNREAFNEGMVNFYEWISRGSSYTPSEIVMALLYGQLQISSTIVEKKRRIFQKYEEFFYALNCLETIRYSSCHFLSEHNGHLFYVVLEEPELAQGIKNYLFQEGIEVRSHFVPLHLSKMGSQFLRPINHLQWEEKLGQQLIRLPIYPDLAEEEQEYILFKLGVFFEGCL